MKFFKIHYKPDFQITRTQHLLELQYMHKKLFGKVLKINPDFSQKNSKNHFDLFRNNKRLPTVLITFDSIKTNGSFALEKLLKILKKGFGGPCNSSKRICFQLLWNLKFNKSYGQNTIKTLKSGLFYYSLGLLFWGN